jgi:hypothetical protein
MRDLIIQAGHLLYGPNFKRSMAKDLDVHERTMQRWLSGVNDPPDHVMADLQNILAKRIDQLVKVYNAQKRKRHSAGVKST